MRKAKKVVLTMYADTQAWFTLKNRLNTNLCGDSCGLEGRNRCKGCGPVRVTVERVKETKK